MPELPEVETVARGLRALVVGKRVKEVIIHTQKKVFGSPAQWRAHVHGAGLISVQRRGKWLVLDFSTGWHAVIHLKMTGQLLVQPKSARRTTAAPTFLGGHTMGTETTALPNSHTRAEFVMTDGSRLFFQDMRLFGYVHLLDEPDLQEYFERIDLGPEPGTPAFSFVYFTALCSRRSKTSVKAMLLDQSAIAGLGNIYVDEACFVARIRPQRRVGSLIGLERRALYLACTRILKQAIALGGTSFSHYYQVDGTIGQYWHKRRVYGRTGEPCKRCRTPIQKTRAAGRGTHYCMKCQK